jgi:hypothetical protein
MFSIFSPRFFRPDPFAKCVCDADALRSYDANTVRRKGAQTKKTDLNLAQEWHFPSQFEICPPVYISGDNHARNQRIGHPKSGSQAMLLHSSNQAASTSTAHRHGECETDRTPTNFYRNLPGSSESALDGQTNQTASNDEKRAQMNKLFINIDDAPLVSVADRSKTKTYIVHPEKKQRVFIESAKVRLCKHRPGRYLYGHARVTTTAPKNIPRTCFPRRLSTHPRERQ